MEDNSNLGNVPSNDSCSNSSEVYLAAASSAVHSGDKMLGIHLYLAAFERASNESLLPSSDVLDGMEEAWKLALELKQRSIAEFIFEKLEPYWSTAEALHHAGELQNLALSKLEEFGFDPGLIKEMAQMVDFDLDKMKSGVVFQFGSGQPTLTFGSSSPSEAPSREDALPPAEEKSDNYIPFTGPNPLKEPYLTEEERRLKKAEEVHAQAIEPVTGGTPVRGGQPITEVLGQNRFDYSSIIGFEDVVESMADFGVGCSSPEFDSFVAMLNRRHGLPHMPSLGTLVFRGATREDANYFMVATAGELALPAVRMRLDENMQGQVVLSVMASPDFRIPLNRVAQTGFEHPATLILEDLDLWNLPPLDVDLFDPQSLSQIELSRGAREALALITSALDSPDVNVLISARHPEDILPFFAHMLDAYRTVDVPLPSEQERTSLWRNAFAMHPSLRGLDLEKMVAFSRSLSRFEIYLVTTQALEDAYRRSLKEREFVPVTTDDMLTRLACFQPIDSWEYRKMEDLLIEHFRVELDSLDDLLEG